MSPISGDVLTWFKNCIFPKGNHHAIIIQKVVLRKKVEIECGMILLELYCLVYGYIDCTSIYFQAIHCGKFGYCCFNSYWYVFFSKKLHKFVNIQYVAVTRTINSILYVCNRFHCPIYRQIHWLLTWMLTLIGSLWVGTCNSTIFLSRRFHRPIY